MAITIVATPGAADANSYATKAEADTYHQAHLSSSTWDDADTDTRNRALVMATRLLDEHLEWTGDVASDDQALLWPRSDMFYASGVEIPSDEIPQKLKEATAELARQLIAADRTADDDVSSKGITRIAAGAVDLSFSGYTKPNVIPDAVYYMVRTWGTIRRRSETNVKLVRA